MNGDRGLVSGDQYLGGLFAFVYQAIRKRLPLMIAAALVVAAIAYFLAPRPRPIFEMQTRVENGRAAGGEPIDLGNTIARINAPSFKRNLLQLLNLPVTDQAGRLIFDSLTARAETSDIAIVSLRALNEEQGRHALDLVVKALNDEQREVREPLLSGVKAQISETDANISSLLKIRETLQDALMKMTKAPATGGTTDTQDVDFRGAWLSDALSRNEQTLTIARATRRELASRLEKPNTHPTAIVDDIVVLPIPTSPRPVGIALLAGLFTFLGAVVFTVMSYRRKMTV
jgi:hypothetical protein